MEHKILLTKEQSEILSGAKGAASQKMMETLVRFGDVFNAQKLVEVTHKRGHLVTSFGIGLLKPLYKIMDDLIEGGIKAEHGFTVDPRPIDYENVKCNLLYKFIYSKKMFGQQARYEEQLKKIGLVNSDSFSCACYQKEMGNTPGKGDILSWAESSAVVYANSVLGARCNRNSAMIDLFGTLLGVVPYFGLLTDEGRKAQWVIKVKTSSKPEAQILGSAIGKKVMDDVPYIIGLDKYIGTNLNDEGTVSYLKDFGAAQASNGAVGLYHVDNVTPEAVELGEELIKKGAKEYIIDDKELDRIYREYPVMWKNKEAKPKLCFIGCPHLSMTQLNEWTLAIVDGLKQSGQGKIALRTILTASPFVVTAFKKTTNYAILMSTGAKLASTCPLMYTNNPLTKGKPILTNSNKLRTYSTARYYADSDILKIVCGIKE